MFVPATYANDIELSRAKYNEIQTKVNSMGIDQLKTSYSQLMDEKDILETEVDENPSQNGSGSSVANRLKEIAAELTAIQKALAAIAGLGVLSALSDDGYNDNVPPVISISGSSSVIVELGSSYADEGASANDDNHGSTPVSSSGSVDTTSVGIYIITYTATDLDGNTATATRTVNVVDTTAPVVTVTGTNPASVELGATYTDSGANATDASGTVTVVTAGTVDANTVGSYTLTYTATDGSGNTGTATRIVNVTDTTAPVFTSSSTFMVNENLI